MPLDETRTDSETGHLSDHNLIHAFINDAEEWVTYTPVLTQLGTVPHNKIFAEYLDVGGILHVRGSLTVNGAGGTGGNAITVTLPATAPNPAGAPSFGFPAGTGRVRDDSIPTTYNALILLVSTTTFQFVPLTASGTAHLGVGTFTAALASGDSITFMFSYRPA
jgi:hypothetical protein